MSTTYVPPLGAINPNVPMQDLIADAYEGLLEAQGDADKADEIENACYYEGLVDALSWIVGSATTPYNKEQDSMAKKEHLDAIENTLDTVTDTVETLERIPKVNLNGTTKNEQLLILGTVAVVSVTIGVLGNNLIRKSLGKLRRKKNKVDLEGFDLNHNASRFS